MAKSFDNPADAASYGPTGFVTEAFPGRGGISWAHPPEQPKPSAGPGIGSPYGYDSGSGFLSRHWRALLAAEREAGSRRRR